MKISLDGNFSANKVRKSTQMPQSDVFRHRLSADSVCFSSTIPKMNYTKKEQEAYNLAQKLFEGQFRKDKKTPAFNHSKFVGEKLKQAGYDEDTVAAGFLHDVTEDIKGWTIPKIGALFGNKTAKLIEEVSHKNINADWETRLTDYLGQMETISPEGSAIVACDKMSSMQDDLKNFKIEGAALFNKLSANPAQQLFKHRAIYNTVMRKTPPKEPIAREYTRTMLDYSDMTGSIIYGDKQETSPKGTLRIFFDTIFKKNIAATL